MTFFEASRGHQSGGPSLSAITDAVMRATGLLALMGIAVIHLVQLVPTFQSTPILGIAFVMLIASTLAVGVRLINSRLSHAQLWLPVVALGVAAIGGYVFTRVVSTPIDNQDVGNWACMLGIAALFVEGTLVALGAYGVSLASRRIPITSPAQTDRAEVLEPDLALARLHANGARR